ncbi:reverse transcriptase domain-containing protein [Tanacetum coccineum]
MLVEVGKFTFPADFIILEMEEDIKVSLILGRPFLHTVDAVIRVKQKQLNLGVGTERMNFNIYSAMKHSGTDIKKMTKIKTKTGQNRVRDRKERKITRPTVPSDLNEPARNPFYGSGQLTIDKAQ